MSNRTILEEQAAFDAMLGSLLQEHGGKFVLFEDGQVVDFFPTHTAAYEAGLDRFGLDSPFLVAEVKKETPHPVSYAWDAGVMFG